MGKARQRKKSIRYEEDTPQTYLARLIFFMNGLLDEERVAKKIIKSEGFGSYEIKIAKEEIVKRTEAISKMFKEAWNV